MYYNGGNEQINPIQIIHNQISLDLDILSRVNNQIME